MKTYINLINVLQKKRIIINLFCVDPIDSLNIANNLFESGISVIEFSLNMSGCLDIILKVKIDLDERIIIGVSDVINSESARSCLIAGADYFSSTVLDSKIIEVAHRYGKPAIPGAMTPNEILHASTLGANLFNVCPAGLLPPNYIKAILAPLPDVYLIATGRITIQKIRSLIQAGCFAVKYDLIFEKDEYNHKNIHKKIKHKFQAINQELIGFEKRKERNEKP